MDEALTAAADAAASEVEEIDGKRFERVRVVTRDGVAVAFYRRVDVTLSEDATLLTVLLDEASPGRWDALNASDLRAGGSRGISIGRRSGGTGLSPSTVQLPRERALP